jgi:hypothetical protein
VQVNSLRQQGNRREGLQGSSFDFAVIPKIHECLFQRQRSSFGCGPIRNPNSTEARSRGRGFSVCRSASGRER